VTECSSCGTEHSKFNPEDTCVICAYPLFPTPELIQKYEQEMKLAITLDEQMTNGEQHLRKQTEESDRIESEEDEKFVRMDTGDDGEFERIEREEEESDRDGSEYNPDTEEN
jgi:hypothetical protein